LCPGGHELSFKQQRALLACRPQLKRDPLDGPMKLSPLAPTRARELLHELRAMANLPPGPASEVLGRAKEIRFQLRNQAWANAYLAEKLDTAYRHLEVLLSARRWREVSSVDGLRHEIKAACARAESVLTRRGGGRLTSA